MLADADTRRREERVWRLLLWGIGAAIVFGLGLRWYVKHLPAPQRLGVYQHVVPYAPGAVVVHPSTMPGLGTIGGCVSVRSGTLEVFLVRTGQDSYAACRTRSVQGRALRYYRVPGTIAYFAKPEVTFSPTTGLALTPGIDDRLVTLRLLVRPDRVEIQRVAG